VGLHHRAYHTNGLFDLYKTTFESSTTTEVDYHLEEGLDIYLAIRVNKIGDELLVTFTDHTTLVKLQHQLQHYINELKHSNDSLEEFTAAASHDLKEPIRKINFLVSVLKKRQKVEEEPDLFNTFEKLELATRRMIHLVDNLLEYSHLSYIGKAAEPVDLNSLLPFVLTDLELVVEEKKAAITHSNLPVINGNELQLQQLFENLLSNSLKYSKKNTPPLITLTASLVAGSSIADERAEGRMYHLITITDNGIGFQQEYAEKIFNVFERLHGNYEYKGSGIGLSIVRKVAENHGGFITASGNIDEGAVFRLYLPV
jgi:light-regulated signal transduction histidine kinase (bacteriophytochrome)